MNGSAQNAKRFFDDLTVYICTFREEDNIVPCIEAVRANGCRKIVVVDASPDGLTEKKALQAGAEVIKSPKGLASQRQRAVEHCQDEFLLFVDADDRLAPGCVEALRADMETHGYAAVQACLGVQEPVTYWQKAADALWRKCLFRPGPTNMVGRPALYRHQALAAAGLDCSFDGVGDEDAALSIRLERLGCKQGIGSGVCLRSHPPSFRENLAAWRKYGKGDALLMKRYPDKRLSILSHLMITYPLRRGWCLVRRGAGRYAGFCLAMGLFRLIFLMGALIKPISERPKVAQ